MTFNIDLYDLRRREVQALGAALSCRDWYMTEKAYNSLRDKLDNAGFTVSGPPTTPKPPAGGDAGAVLSKRQVAYAYLKLRISEKRDIAKAIGLPLPDSYCGQLEQEKAFLRSVFDAGRTMDLGAALALPAPVVEGERWRHVKRGTVYEVIGYAELQNGNVKGLREGAELVVYRGEDGKLWARERGEFHDGRFAALSEGRSHG